MCSASQQLEPDAACGDCTGIDQFALTCVNGKALTCSYGAPSSDGSTCEAVTCADNEYVQVDGLQCIKCTTTFGAKVLACDLNKVTECAKGYVIAGDSQSCEPAIDW